MKGKIVLYAIFLLFLTSEVFALKCAHEFDSSYGTCISKTYNMLMNKGQAYYSCDLVINNRWYFNNCTATVSSTNITSDNGSIVAEYWSNEANKVSACAGRDGWSCNTNPMYGFQTDTNLNYVGYCDSSQETCVKCSSSHTEVKKFDGTGQLKVNINGDGNNLCESGCFASIECDEKNQGYNVGNAGCTVNCAWNVCGNYKWNNASSTCYDYCQNNQQCYGGAVCDLAININTCVVDSDTPKYYNVGQYDLTLTPDNSLISGDLVLLSAYWTDNVYLNHSILELEINGSWIPYMTINNISVASYWTNYTVNTSFLFEKNLNWRIRVVDVAGNTNTTINSSFYVYSESANFSITLNLTEGNYIDFIGWASAEFNKAPENNVSWNLAEITLTHTGRGVATKYSFKTNESLPSTIRIKLSNNFQANNAINLTDSYQSPAWCNNNIRGDTCQIWVWMDLDAGNDPQELYKSILIQSEQI